MMTSVKPATIAALLTVVLLAGVFSPSGAVRAGSINQDWVSRYNGPANNTDEAVALALDGSGNVYVTGSSRGAGTGFDYATVKYDADGVEQWVARYNGPADGDDTALALAVDGAGNVYVTGKSDGGSGTGTDYATVKYNSAGGEEWAARYSGPTDGDDAANAVAVDAAGNVYVTGGSPGSGTGSDYATVKYDAAGVEQWVRRYDGLASGADSASALAVDGSGNVYVTGFALVSNAGWGNIDYVTIKYDTDGVQKWEKAYNGGVNTYDFAWALAVDATGNVYVAGTTSRLSWLSFNDDYATVKYSASGVQQWARTYDSGVPPYPLDEAKALAVDSLGNVYVTGDSASGGADFHFDYLTVKYNSSGVQQWLARYNGPADGDDFASAIALDASGNLYVAGQSDSDPAPETSSGDYTTVMYDGDGVQLAELSYDGPAAGDDVAFDVAVDGAGNIFVTGGSPSAGSGSDYATVKYCGDLDGDTICDDVDPDMDGDGCANEEELPDVESPKPGATGAFDPADPYDFFDVPVPAEQDPTPNGARNGLINLGDVLAVLLYFGADDGGLMNANGVDYDSDKDGDTIEDGRAYDRSASPSPNPPWGAGPPNGSVNMEDVLAVLAQVGLECVGP